MFLLFVCFQDVSAPNVTCRSTNVSVDCDWQPAPDTFMCGNQSVFYQVCFAGTKDQQTNCDTKASNETSFQKTELNPCSDYQLTVTPLVIDPIFGSLNGSSAVFTMVTGSSLPTSPVSVDVKDVTNNGLTVLWSEPSTVHCEVVSYGVWYNPVTSGPNGPCNTGSQENLDSTGNSVQLTNLCACRKYNISVAAATEIGYGPSTTVEATTLPTTPDAVRFSVTNSTNTSIFFSWFPDLGNCYVTYKLELTTGDKPIDAVTTNRKFAF